MKSTRPPIVFAALLALGLWGCSKGEACTKARLQAADAWKDVTEQAGKLKLAGGATFEELPKDKQAEHTKEFTTVESQSDLVFKSFAYEKITWGTAGPAREKAMKTWDDFFNKDKYPTFGGTLKVANTQYDAVKAACGAE